MNETAQEPENSDEQGLRLFGDYIVRAYDKSGDLAQATKVEETGSVEIEDVFENAVTHQLDRIEIVPLRVELRDDLGTVEAVELDDKPDLKP